MRYDVSSSRKGKSVGVGRDHKDSVAEQFNTCHHEIEIKDQQFDSTIAGKILDQFDQPFADSSAIPTYLVCREMRKHVKVVIGGDGGDEMFGGYPRFRYADMAQALGRVPKPLLRAAESSCAALSGIFPETTRQARRLLGAATVSGPERICALGAYVRVEDVPNILNQEALAQIGSYTPSLCTGIPCNGHAGGAELVDATIVNELPGEYLRVFSPSAEVRGHGPGQEVLQKGKREVNIRAIDPVGVYAVKLVFSDGHETGIYSWDYLYDLGVKYQDNWNRYLARLEQAGASRDP